MNAFLASQVQLEQGVHVEMFVYEGVATTQHLLSVLLNRASYCLENMVF